VAQQRNWGGNVVYRATRVECPASIEELSAIAASAAALRVLGSRHSFNDSADGVRLVSLRGLPSAIEIDRAAATVTCPAALSYGELAAALAARGLALSNLGSLPHISIGGAVATATHGSGDTNGNLATSVAGIELVTSAGELLTVSRGERDFDGMVVGLGALGAVTRLTLDVEPAYEVAQRIYHGLTWESLDAHFDEITGCGYSVSVFTRWEDDRAGLLWVKRRVASEGPARHEAADLEARFAVSAATEQLHPIPGGDPQACTAQLGVPGPWHERLPHFRPQFTPSAGEEIQSEYLLARADARAALAALRPLASAIRPLLHIGELRTVAADMLWMSPQHGRDTVAIHFTWRRDQRRVEDLLVDIEAALAPFAPRPHWGKVFMARADSLAPRYERWADFLALRARLDPREAFRNAWLERCVLGVPAG
jgi:xylitol oxidase